MQYNRISKKEVLDLVNGRFVGFIGPNSFSSKVGKILYYTAIQNLIFYSMQTALFAMMFGGDDDEEFFKKKKHRVADNMADGILRGLGVHGAIISTVKNIILKRAAGKDKDSILVEALKVSPPMSIKARQLLSADRSLRWDMDIMKEMETFDIDNPMWNTGFNIIEFATNAPLSRMQSKYINIREALNKDHEAWQRLLMLGGWSPWNLGIKNKQIEEIKEEIKAQKTYDRKKKAKEKKQKEQAEKQAVINKQVNKEKELQEKGILKNPKCSYISTKGNRCKKSVSNAGDLCTIHEEVPQRADGKKTQCKKVKADGKKCKMKTSNKSGYCYYHD